MNAIFIPSSQFLFNRILWSTIGYFNALVNIIDRPLSLFVMFVTSVTHSAIFQCYQLRMIFLCFTVDRRTASIIKMTNEETLGHHLDNLNGFQNVGQFYSFKSSLRSNDFFREGNGRETVIFMI